VHRAASTFMQNMPTGESNEESGEVSGDEETPDEDEAPGSKQAPGTRTLDSGPAMVDEQLKALIEQNIFIKEDGHYAATVSYKDGEIVLNGRPLSLQNLMQ